MRRIVPIILSILVGALAVAGGMGFYLSEANADRGRLARLVEEAATKAEVAQAEGRRTVDEANRKLEEAKVRIETAQAALKAMEDERALIAKAKTLPEPPTTDVKGWVETANVELGLSIRHPSVSTPLSNERSSFVLGTSGASLVADNGPYRWFLAQPHSDRLEREIVDALVATSSVLLLQQGHLLSGTNGIGPDGTTVFVLKTFKDSRPDLLIWARDPLKAKDSRHLMNALATLKFAD
jgi:polyhydroxyalkanoate synthesis regulator phasin